MYYDEMDYDDELNDQEEKEYRKEFLNKKREEKKAAQVQPMVKELPKRATRGLRMTALVGKAIEEDEEFWN